MNAGLGSASYCIPAGDDSGEKYGEGKGGRNRRPGECSSLVAFLDWLTSMVLFSAGIPESLLPLGFPEKGKRSCV